MISDFLTIFKLKLKYLFNLTLYNSKKSFFKTSFSSIEYSNNNAVALYAFFIYFIVKLLYYLLFVFIFVCYPLVLMGSFNINSFFTLSIILSMSLFSISSNFAELKEDKLYAIEYLKINKRSYYFVDIILKLINHFILIFGSITAFKFLYSLDQPSVIDVLVLTFVCTSIKIIFNYIYIINPKVNKFKIFFFIISFIAAYLLCYLNVSILTNYYSIILTLLSVTNLLFIYLIYKFKYYDNVYDYEFEKFKRGNVAIKNYEKKVYANDLIKESILKTNNPYNNYLNIFQRRYKKFMPKTINGIFIILFILFLILGVFCFQSSYVYEIVNMNIKYGLSSILLFSVIFNNSSKIIKIFYEKSDIFMNNHNFFIEEKTVNCMFLNRLKFLFIKNLPISLLISISGCILYFITGGTNLWYEYIFILISFLYILFSICCYYLLVYYIFSPYEYKLNKINYKLIFLSYLPHYLSFLILTNIMSITTFTFLCLIIFIFVLFIMLIWLFYRKKIKIFKNNLRFR